MDTSRPWTPPAPVLAGPRRAPGPLAAAAKKPANRHFVSKWQTEIFRRIRGRKIIQTQPYFTKWMNGPWLQQPDRFNPAISLGSGSEMNGGWDPLLEPPMQAALPPPMPRVGRPKAKGAGRTASGRVGWNPLYHAGIALVSKKAARRDLPFQLHHSTS